MKRASAAERRALSRCTCAVAGALLIIIGFGAPLYPARAQPQRVSGNERLLVVNARGGIGSMLGPAGQIIRVDQGQVTGVVTRGLLWPYQGGLAPAADGRSVVFGNERAGIWSVRLDGINRHRLAAPPFSTGGNALGVEHITWSVQGRLAFAVNNESDILNNQVSALGIWVMPLHGGAAVGRPPRRVASPAQVGAQASASMWSLAWSLDGTRLVTSPTNLPSTVVSLDVAHATTRVLVRGGGEAAVSPTSGDLAYVTGGLHRGAASSLWIAGAEGRHRTLILTVHGLISHPVWSPDGREIAYIGPRAVAGAVGAMAVHVVSVATRIDREVLRAEQANRFLLQRGYFADLAWIPPLRR